MGPGWDHRCHRWHRQPAGNRGCLTQSQAGWSSHLGLCSQRLLPSTGSRHPHLLRAPAPGHSSSAAHQRCQLSRHVKILQQQLWKSIPPTLLGQAWRMGGLRQLSRHVKILQQQLCKSNLPTLLWQAWRMGELRQQPWASFQRSLPRQACREDLPSTAHLCHLVDPQHGLQAQLQVPLRRLLTCRVARCL